VAGATWLGIYIIDQSTPNTSDPMTWDFLVGVGLTPTGRVNRGDTALASRMADHAGTAGGTERRRSDRRRDCS
jgi:hypothetical protein